MSNAVFLTSRFQDFFFASDDISFYQKVCSDWYKVCKDPSMWRVIDLYEVMDDWDISYTERIKLCKRVVDRSQGQLVEIKFPGFFMPNDVLMDVADRASKLKLLNMYIGSSPSDDISMKSLPEALKKFPLLEEKFAQGSY
ncbi:F-box protein SKIP19-like [Rutidosis leptorrhynchoides]|uniref:F-box protein SKIP19-like n=1 Tax=Rutidosis leptorrhynchoides TaxID=125765 RepID=UPI003A995CCF